ncbi:phage portal protein [Avibacterium paragallinarum]|uniref:phage portal protein n=1 Tax=Avibacterium paragallinarum TaxID=728 RepID=UPI00188EC428|nr:DUF1073 domain-containing protein [Avibacterium paragallinarum]QZP14641.1 DUF1073 domain-containing protein [Avibacterium paragallinarum]WAL56324.1 DUF1073 domain-containing protein [Avibacterium paragallinarum]WAM58909.1 DUF1073 domain-containing protein [Avibacterium paragallinarum]
MPFNQDGYADALGLNHFQKTSQKSTALLDLTLYELGGLAARVVDMPADAAISRSVEIEGDEDKAIFNELDRLKILPALADMVRWSRLFGGSVMLLLTDDGAKLSEPLNINKLNRIDEVRVFDLSQISPTTRRYLDPRRTNYGRFETYRLNIGAVNGSLESQVEIHESRLLFMGGDPMPERLKNGLHWIGRSMVKTAYQKIRDYQKSLTWSSLILERKQQAVHKMKGLALAIGNGLEDQIRERINLVERGRNLLNGVAVDFEDDYTILNADLNGIIDVLDEFKIAISADVNIPVAILFGQSAKGMNATGKSDFESYYDLIEGIQQHKIKPVLEQLIELIMRQKHITPFENWQIHFPSLNTPTDKEQAEARKLNAEAAKAEIGRLIDLVDSGALSTQELRQQIAEELGVAAAALPEVSEDDINDYQKAQKAKEVAVS